jgi:hypothetical protein
MGKAGKIFVESDLRSTRDFIPVHLAHGPQGSVLRGKYCHVSIFHVTIPARSKSFSVTSRHIRHASVIPFRSISFILLSPHSVELRSFRHSLLLCLSYVPIMFLTTMFHISSALSFSDLWLSSFLIFPIILLVNNYPYCSSRIYDFIY